MPDNTTTSIIIPAYNRAGFLREALDSVMAQTCRDFEVIVVDDGSSDGTADVARSYPANVRCIRQDNKGAAAARNTGIRNARGHFVAFLDSDDIWHHEKLARQLAQFRSAPSIGLAATAYETTGEHGEAKSGVFLSEHDLRSDKRRLTKNIFATSSVMVRKSCFEMVGLFDERLRFAEDWDMWLRILDRYDYDYLPEALVLYRYHSANTTTASWQTNMRDWECVIGMRSTGGTPLSNNLLKRKRMSWMYVNQAVAFRGVDRSMEQRCLLASIAAWPFSMPGRYASLLRGIVIRPRSQATEGGTR